MQSRLQLVSVILTVLLVNACDSSTSGPEPVPIAVGTSLEITSRPESLFVGRTAMLRLRDTTDTEANTANYIWATTDTAVAVVDSTGRVRGKAIGTARITAYRAGAYDTLTLRVTLARANAPVAFVAGGQGSGGSTNSADCAIGTDGAVYCRRTGVSADTIPTFDRMPGAAGIRFTSVSTSFWAQCALDEDGAIYCWGNNGHGIMGHRRQIKTDTGPVAVQTALRFSQMQHAGHSQTCGVSRADSLAYCWGHNDSYQLANGGSGDDTLPRAVVGLGKASYVTTENFYSCALDIDGKAHCSGQGAYAAGTGYSGPARVMMQVLGNQRFVRISSGDYFQCAVALDHSGWCWGLNTNGILGIGTNVWPQEAGPQRVLGDLQFRNIQAIYRMIACGVTLDNDLFCWGGMSSDGEPRWTPQQLYRGVKFKEMIGSSCFLTSEGWATCF